MRKALALGTAAAALTGLGLTAAPAQAACAVGDTTCTNVAVVVGVGTLTLAASPVATGGAPLGSAVVGSGATPTVLQGSTLALTTVTDTRTSSPGWSVQAAVSDFVTAGPTVLTIAKSKASLSVPAGPTAVVGTLSSSSYSATPAAVASNGTASLISVVTTGVNTVTYTPRLDLDVNGATAGAYTGTLTQTVA